LAIYINHKMEETKRATVGPKRVNRLLSKPASAAVLSSRSNFVPETKVVVMSSARNIVIDSPCKGKDPSTCSRSTVASLARIGAQHFGLQNKISSQHLPVSASSASGAAKRSSFLSDTTNIQPAGNLGTINKHFDNGNAHRSGVAGSSALSQMVRSTQKAMSAANTSANYLPPRTVQESSAAVVVSVNALAGGGLSAKVKARSSSQAQSSVSFVRPASMQESMMESTQRKPVQQLKQSENTAMQSAHASNPAGTAPAAATAHVAATVHAPPEGSCGPDLNSTRSEGGLSGMFQSMGKTLAVKR
jgi:hypothetical protein